MEVDIAPELLETLQNDFRIKYNGNEKIKKLNKLLIEGKATYQEVNEMASELGEILASVYQNNLSSEMLPNGRMYKNIAEKIINPTMGNNYDLMATYIETAQTTMNRSIGIRIKGIRPLLNQDRIDGIITRVSKELVFDDVKWILNEPVKNFTQAIVDDGVKANSEFQYKAGLRPKIVRKEVGNCCDWCKEVVGTYTYPDVPEDVYRRHRYCRCTVEYYPGDGKRQDVHTKKWIDPEIEGKIKVRKGIGIKKKTEYVNKKLEEKIKNELIPSENTQDISQGSQNKHRAGTNEYKSVVERYKSKGEYGPGIIYLSDDEILYLVNEFKGTGIPRISNDEWQRVETVINNEKIVGTVVNNLSGKKAETSVFKIHYSDKGVHISPDYPSKRRKR